MLQKQKTIFIFTWNISKQKTIFIFTWNISKTFEYSNQVPIYFVKSKLSIPRKLAFKKNIFLMQKD